MSKDKGFSANLEEFWYKKGRKDFFTWVHRYLRLHNELLEDSVYKKIYDYFRDTLTEYLKRDMHDLPNDENLGNLVDLFVDIFNKFSAIHVEKYKSSVDYLYEYWKSNPNISTEIRI